MKTRCYCVYCKSHPFHDKFMRGELKDINIPVLFDPCRSIYEEEEKAGADVDCLEPVSDAFDYLSIEPEDFYWKLTAYCEGAAITVCSGIGFDIYAICKNETYEEPKLGEKV